MTIQEANQQKKNYNNAEEYMHYSDAFDPGVFMRKLNGGEFYQVTAKVNDEKTNRRDALENKSN